jgi:hypothetical protein
MFVLARLRTTRAFNPLVDVPAFVALRTMQDASQRLAFFEPRDVMFAADTTHDLISPSKTCHHFGEDDSTGCSIAASAI